MSKVDVHFRSGGEWESLEYEMPEGPQEWRMSEDPFGVFCVPVDTTDEEFKKIVAANTRPPIELPTIVLTEEQARKLGLK